MNYALFSDPLKEEWVNQIIEHGMVVPENRIRVCDVYSMKNLYSDEELLAIAMSWACHAIGHSPITPIMVARVTDDMISSHISGMHKRIAYIEELIKNRSEIPALVELCK